ncbi:hydrolase, TatD family [Chloroherpeton thalassium ATCC 35110]|uniref:Hydrolase, TatD family n=1 Tax=Chloroherpeton thalassium (strain ATCC 35110 / GB-78) TaxID=517418 RepID=B3QSL7_CHLT3|nr:TatD family hydrolase [Chloroherpeton thalassium]ACF14064.1 hydrolase, TatD family [Chloroherpeton thalassium ATCC 35110]
MFVDAHCHLAFPQFAQDLGDVIDRMKANRVGLLLHPGTGVETSKDAIQFCETSDFAFANVGLHPGDIDEVTDETFLELEQLAKHKKNVAIGEIGLDYHYPNIDKAKQQECFREMLRMAKRLDFPVVIHTRDAWPDTFRILEEEASSGLTGMMHCFSGGVAEAKRCLKLGFKISIPGVVTFKKSLLPEVVEALALSDLLTETDCPYLAPVPYRGKRNEPAYVVEVAKKIAEIKNVPLESVEQTVYENTIKLFRIEEKVKAN